MIDKNGKKITLSSKDEDKEFMYSEIRFMVKSFKNESDDQKAERLARRMNDFICLFKEEKGLEDTFSLLEEHANNTQSEDFLWEMVYIMRKKASLDKKEYSFFRGECYCTSAMYLDKICSLNRTTHNMCCETLEFLLSSENYFESQNDSKALDLAKETFLIAESCFERVKDDGSIFYIETGQELYRVKYTQCENDAKDEHDILKELARFSVELFFRNNDIKTLEYIVLIYKTYSSFKFFSFEHECETLYKLVDYIDKLAPNNSEYVSIRNDLKKIINKCLSSNDT